jgi:PhnB protein
VGGNTVAEPRICDTKPARLELQPGKYFWCACGQSKNQPWCDGSHKGGAFTPVEFVVEEARQASMCLCKHTKNRPFCDGSHKPLREAAAATVNPVPAHYAAATPYLCCPDAAKAIEFYKDAFGAVEVMRLAEPSGKIGHAEMKVGNALFMLADEYPEFGVNGPAKFGGTPVRISLFVPDVDAAFKRALAAGAKELMPVQKQFFGDRSGTLQDPFGHIWMISTHVENVSTDEMQRRYNDLLKGA